MRCRRHPGLVALVLAVPLSVAAQEARPPRATTTPIEHLIVVVGENLSFDNLFGTYEPPARQTIANLLSRGIVNADGSPGPNMARAAQRIAAVRQRYEVTPTLTGAYATLPQPGTTHATGQPRFTGDQRFPADMPNGPFQITRFTDYAAYVGDPVHRFFQMWQQLDGGRNDLFVWVAMTSGEGSRHRADPASGTNQGGVAMGFYNMARGDAPYFRELARRYALADNYHQSIMGGTGANFVALATGHVAVYLADGKPAVPPPNQIENPEPRPGTNNWYTQSGYRGGSYVNCADRAQPGVAAIRGYLEALPYKTLHDGNCAPGHYYLVNNYGTGYTASGEAKPLGPDKFTLPPQTAPTIAEALAAKGVSWTWYSGGRTAQGIDPRQYCGICDPLTHSTAIMTEGFLRGLVAKVQANPAVWEKTAILITTDEGGGYYDSGYVQILDFFGDGTRVAMLAVSPFARRGHVDHTYYDHASILKFIERNWGLAPLSTVSRDNLPNPVTSAADPYVPQNRPAIGDLMNLFRFSGRP